MFVFNEKENPTTDLLSGKIYFHIFWLPPIPAEEIDFAVEIDPDYFSTLFG